MLYLSNFKILSKMAVYNLRALSIACPVLYGTQEIVIGLSTECIK